MKIKDLNQTIQKPKKKISPAERLALCQEWKQSGLTTREFSKLRNISSSALYQWSNRLSKKISNTEENWMPIKVVQTRKTEFREPISVSIELSLPNQCVARVQLLRSEAVSFLQEMCHATAIIR